ncbi:MAG: hypothetical protein C4524_07650 [Candidatus Zixiibacteriota bacterium]|nr:MAG: hypothetical protein C4524_07650 [candidate division Zixibacteria bacterium]
MTGKPITLGILFLALLGAALPAAGSSREPYARVVVLPWKNLGSQAEARDELMPEFVAELGRAGFEAVGMDSVRASLRRHRVRETGALSQRDAWLLSRDLGTPWILVGALDIYQDEPVEAGLSARLMNSTTGDLLWADAFYATGLDHAGLLGLGEVSDPRDLARDLLGKLVRSLQRTWLEHPERIYDEIGSQALRPGLILVPFGNSSATSQGHWIVQNVLLGLLVGQGYRVIEPGMATQALRDYARFPQGEIDLAALDSLAARFDADYCLTGHLTEYRVDPDPSGADVPVVDLETRLLEAATGRIIWAGHAEHSGADFIKIFQVGMIRSPGRLLQETFARLLPTLPAPLGGKN